MEKKKRVPPGTTIPLFFGKKQSFHLEWIQYKKKDTKMVVHKDIFMSPHPHTTNHNKSQTPSKYLSFSLKIVQFILSHISHKKVK